MAKNSFSKENSKEIIQKTEWYLSRFNLIKAFQKLKLIHVEAECHVVLCLNSCNIPQTRHRLVYLYWNRFIDHIAFFRKIYLQVVSIPENFHVERGTSQEINIRRE